jgi:L-fuculose-phosphate aldolase
MISSFGSVSVRLTGNDFLITPRNISRWEIGLEDIIQIKESRREPGKLPDKSVNIHQEIYRSNPHINSIIITQTPNIMAFGVSPQKMDVRSIPESWIFLPEIPVLPFGAQFSENINMRSVLIKNTASVSIIQNDSVIATGNSLQQSYDMLEAAEFSAKYLSLCKSIGEPVPLSPDQILEIEEKFL